MKYWFSVILSLVVVFSQSSWSNTSVSKEVQTLLDKESAHYIQALKTTEGEELIELALKLQDSGITDKEVLDTAEKIALAQHEFFNHIKNKKTKKKKGDKEKANNAYRAAASLARFLAGSGNTDYFTTLDTFMRESKSRGLRNLSKTLMTRTGWYIDRNEIMNDFSSYEPGKSLYQIRYTNLLNAQDRTYGRYAAESMRRQNNTDKVLVSRMAELIDENFTKPGEGNQLDAIAWYIRFIGREALDDHRDLLEKVSAYPLLDKKLKKHVNKALKGK